ncbi:MAG: PstS family phosphate ABC transporter substrate-binding protein [Nitrospinae bacterium]|nr:PstS family phosphate ABC transporter substrate-binding protein [Nitrospinota bacterium]MZH14511.1 PstS family phosphate ABC transporter substrate-binding protein [Nitrospinota bacterium]
MKRLLMFFALSTVFLLSLGGNSLAGKISGKVRIDGSSTVFPITEAVAEEFQKKHRKVRVTVGISGTGGGFKKFTTGQTDINDASRPIKSSEKKKAAKNGIDYMVIPVAYDGLSVVINPDNDFVDHLTTTELKKIWQPESTVKKWSDVRPGWPDKAINLYGPGVDSGTFDYFTKAVNGRSQASRSDFTASEDDNVLVMGVAGDKYALGYFGYAYYKENKSRLNVVAIDPGDGPVKPDEVTINDGSYKPLSRPIFIYVSKPGAQRTEVNEFVKFYIQNAGELSKEVGYIPLAEKDYKASLEKFEKWSNNLLGENKTRLNVKKASLR